MMERCRLEDCDALRYMTRFRRGRVQYLFHFPIIAVADDYGFLRLQSAVSVLVLSP